jgi:DNA polymerase-3 subunit epsilon
MLADHLGLRFVHHNAAEDAAVCAQAAIEMARAIGAAAVHAIPALIGMKPGRLMPSGYEPCTCRKA